MENKITGEMPMPDFLSKYPQAAKNFAVKGVAGLGCAASMFETVEPGSAAHGIGSEGPLAVINRAVGD